MIHTFNYVKSEHGLLVRSALEGIKAELDAMAALKGFRLQRMRAYVGAGLNALSSPALRDGRTFHYVKNEQALDWLRLGWIIAKPNCEMHHDYYSVVMEWLCDCKMVRPR